MKSLLLALAVVCWITQLKSGITTGAHLLMVPAREEMKN